MAVECFLMVIVTIRLFTIGTSAEVAIDGGVSSPLFFTNGAAVLENSTIFHAMIIAGVIASPVARPGVSADAQREGEEALQFINHEFSEAFTGEAGYVGVIPLPRPDDPEISDLNYPFYYHPNGCSTSALTHPHLKPYEEYDRNVSRLSSYIDFKKACDTHDICYQTPGANFTTCNWRFARDLFSSCTERFTDTRKPFKLVLRWINPLVLPQLPICLQLASDVVIAVETTAMFKVNFIESQKNILKAMIFALEVAREFHEFTLGAGTTLLNLQPDAPALEVESQRYFELSRESGLILVSLRRSIEQQRDHIKHIEGWFFNPKGQ